MMNQKDSWDLITKSINNKNSKIIDKLIQKQKKDNVLILGSVKNLNGINENYKPTKSQLKQVTDLYDEVVQKYPQNWAFRMQGGGNKIKNGSAIYNKTKHIIGSGEYKMRDSTKRFLEGGAIKTYYEGDPVNETPSKYSFGSMVGKELKYLLWDLPFKMQGKKTGGSIKMDKQQLYEKLSQMFGIKGGALTTQQQRTVDDVMKQMKLNKESQKLKNEQKINPLDKKEVARRKVLSGLTDKQKMTYMKMQRKKGKELYDAKVAEFDRLASVERRQNEEDDWRNTQKSDRQAALDEQARLKKIADDKAHRSWGDKLLDAGLDLIPEAAGLIPVKFLQGPAKALLKEGVNQMKGRAKPAWYNKIADLAVEKGLPELTKLIPMKELQDPTEKILRIGVNQLRGKAKPKRKPSAWNIKVKSYMNKYGCSMKEALQALKK